MACLDWVVCDSLLMVVFTVCVDADAEMVSTWLVIASAEELSEVFPTVVDVFSERSLINAV